MNNTQIVKGIYDGFRQANMQAILDRLSDNIVWELYGPEDNPLAGLRRGKQEVGAFFSALDEYFEFKQFDTGEFVEQGDTVVCLGDWTAVVKPTGKTVEMRFAHVFHLRDGKVTQLEDFVDTAAISAGLAP